MPTLRPRRARPTSCAWPALAMVAVTDRFTLASLVLADMRATLRELARQADESIAEAA